MATPTARAIRGQTASELAKRFGVSQRTIQRAVAEPREEYLARAQQRREKIRELRATGMSMRAIATELDCSAATVCNTLKTTDG